MEGTYLLTMRFHAAVIVSSVQVVSDFIYCRFLFYGWMEYETTFYNADSILAGLLIHIWFS